MADKAVFLPRNDLFDQDYECILRNAQNEFSHHLHYHDFYECVLYLGDAGLFEIDGRKYAVRRGDICIIDIFKPHTLYYSKSNYYERFSLSINMGLLISFSTPHSILLDIFYEAGNRHPLYHLSDQAMQNYLVLIEQFRQIQTEKGSDLLEKALVHLFLSYIYSDCYTGSVTDDTDKHHAEVMVALFRYIEDHLHEEISLAGLAEEAHYSEYYLSRLFKKISGKNLTTYIQEKRIERAAALIRKNIPINQAAERSGFNNYSYFYKTFRKMKGLSPADFQNASRPEPVPSAP